LPELSIIRVFFDSDAIIAGSASRKGAAFILLQLAELGLIEGVASVKVIDECRKNLEMKLPEALPAFEQIVSHALNIVNNPSQEKTVQYTQMAHIKDVPILTAAITTNANFLVTFNTKDFYPEPHVDLNVVEPGELLNRIRHILGQMT